MTIRWLPSPPSKGTVAELSSWLDENELRLGIHFNGRWTATLTSLTLRDHTAGSPFHGKALEAVGEAETMLAALYKAIDRWALMRGPRP